MGDGPAPSQQDKSLLINFDKKITVYDAGDYVGGTVCLDLHDSLEIVGKCSRTLRRFSGIPQVRHTNGRRRTFLWSAVASCAPSYSVRRKATACNRASGLTGHWH